MYNNDDNYDGPIFQKQKEEPKNFFSQDQFITTENNYLSNTTNYSFNSGVSNMDIPPELDEIKNLSDANNVSGPTLSALDPMNILPTEPQISQNKLDMYDNGIITNDNEYNINNEDFTSKQKTTNPDDEKDNNFLNTDYNDVQTNSYIKQEPKESVEEENTISSPLEENNIFNPNTSYNMDINNLPDLESSNNVSANEKANYDYGYNYDINNTPDKILSLDEYINNKTNEDDENQKEQEDYNLGINSIPDLSSFMIPENETKELSEEKEKNEEEYKVIQDVNLNKPKIEEIDDIEDLNNIYNEDTLEIMDEDSQDEKKQVVDDIKSHINSLKNEGHDIELEEFDFEDTYQLVIKIKKEEELENEDRTS